MVSVIAEKVRIDCKRREKLFTIAILFQAVVQFAKETQFKSNQRNS